MARGPAAAHDVARQAIVTAACRAVGEHGLEALTFRRVAAAAGVSPGRVQHYFHDRAALVHAAFDAVQERARSRVEAGLASTTRPAPADVVTAILRASVPGDAAELGDVRVVAAFEALALTDPVLGEALGAGHEQLRQLLTGQVALELRGRGDRPALDHDFVATVLLAVAEGLSGQVLHGHLDPVEARRALDGAVRLLLGGPDHGGRESDDVA